MNASNELNAAESRAAILAMKLGSKAASMLAQGLRPTPEALLHTCTACGGKTANDTGLCEPCQGKVAKAACARIGPCRKCGEPCFDGLCDIHAARQALAPEIARMAAKTPARARTGRKSSGTAGKPASGVPVPSESASQQALIRWWHHACHGFGIAEVLLFAVPNAGKRHGGSGGRMVGEGLRAGVSDLMLLAARGGYFGLCLEMKTMRRGSQCTPDQVAFQMQAVDAGYRCAVAYSTDEAIEILSDYCTKPPTENPE